eukprot:7114763-Alexandrium_andersonii.AAC.1
MASGLLQKTYRPDDARLVLHIPTLQCKDVELDGFLLQEAHSAGTPGKFFIQRGKKRTASDDTECAIGPSAFIKHLGKGDV